jgi:hypothetical protein
VLDHSTGSGLFGLQTNEKFCFTKYVPPTEEGKTIVNGKSVLIWKNEAAAYMGLTTDTQKDQLNTLTATQKLQMHL